ncbi:hypothetical protein HBZ99_004761 [Salmonella enterica subsp. enterica]|nr:hypothetical protein [Salmonella enterica subsp. diarizonae]EED9398357.1 hypothetical protein [Salmonella enterica subsp. enterica serovar Oranienburg]EEP4266273.1 hypothetical protein [Salmonella enterica subsp. enterica serovar Oranienburg]EEP8814327.1 hypothetical protein [Salmonella enterica subsp. enterica serovar Oranienburg]EIG0952257.1 hypothetical protein [Salmonella enterica subsp. enterica serovar Muenchen]
MNGVNYRHCRLIHAGKLQPHGCNFLQVFNSTGDIKMRMFQKIAMVSTAATCLALCGNAMATMTPHTVVPGEQTIKAESASTFAAITTPTPSLSVTRDVDKGYTLQYSAGKLKDVVVPLASWSVKLNDPAGRVSALCYDNAINMNGVLSGEMAGYILDSSYMQANNDTTHYHDGGANNCYDQATTKGITQITTYVNNNELSAGKHSVSLSLLAYYK